MCSGLIADARNLLNQLKHSRLSQYDLDERRWNEVRLGWKGDVTSLTSGCDLLIGADGTEVSPQFLTLANLNHASDWMDKAIELANSGDFRNSERLLRLATRATRRAERVIESGFPLNKSTAVVQLPRSLQPLFQTESELSLDIPDNLKQSAKLPSS